MSFNKAKHSLRMSMFNIINIKMKNQIILALFLSFFILSCEKDEDENCHECHIAIEECCGAEEPHAPGEHSIDIGEFCDDDLSDVEANGWVATMEISHDGEVEFNVGDLVPASMIHCEEHADHDHDH